jgi:hypothetical protein
MAPGGGRIAPMAANGALGMLSDEMRIGAGLTPELASKL